MKVYTCLLAFAAEGKTPKILTDSNKQTPLWLLKDEEKQSLQIVTDGLYNISGIGKNWFPAFNQGGVWEFFEQSHKSIIIPYSVYFPSVFELNNLSYQWTSLSDLDENTNIYGMIRYLYGARK